MNQDLVNGIIDRCAKEVGITSDGSIEEVQSCFDPIFAMREGEAWRHASGTDLHFGVDRVITAEVASAARVYLQFKWAKVEVLDWLLADAMVFGEVNASYKNLSPMRFYFSRGEPVIWMMALGFLFRVVLWGAWVVGLFVLYGESHLLAAVLVLATIAYQYVRRSRVQSVAKMLAAMSDVYGALDSCPPSWRNVYALMEKSRDLGAKWPTQLYRLVERNL